MRKGLVLLVLVIGFAVLPSGQSAAAVSGPFCWSIPPFSDVLALTFITDGGNTAAVAGRDVSTNVAVSGAAFLEADGVTVNMVGTVGQASLGGSAFLFQVRFSDVTGGGSGRCQIVNLGAGGCDTGTSIAFVASSCPVGALDAQSSSAGPRAGGDN